MSVDRQDRALLEVPRTDRALLRSAAALSVLGELLYIVVGLFHPDRQPPNNHGAAFSEYAHSHDWIFVHEGQFLAIVIMFAGLVAVFLALDVRTRVWAWLAHFAIATAGLAVALYGVLQAVDGVVLKHAVDAWFNATGPDKTVRFANAETVRWLEWGVRSYAQFTRGMALVLFGVVIAGCRTLPRHVACFVGAAGVGLIIQGLLLGSDGFSSTAIAVGFAALAAEVIWVVTFAVCVRERDQP